MKVFASREKSEKVVTSEIEHSLENALYVVATPIGNLGDITLRAIETLKSADVIACEDTRVTRILLNHFNIQNRVIAVHEHNERNAADGIINLLQQGQRMPRASRPCRAPSRDIRSGVQSCHGSVAKARLTQAHTASFPG